MDKGQLIIEYENLKSTVDEVRRNIDFFADDINDIGYNEEVSEKENDSLVEQESLLYDAIKLIQQAYWKLDEAQKEMSRLMRRGGK